MSQTVPSLSGSLGSFAKVDSTNSSDLVERLDTMHMLAFFRAYKQETFALLGLQPGLAAGDVGCGTGEDARSMADIVGAGGSVIGFDLSEAMLAEAERRHVKRGANLRFVRAPADDLGLPAETLDAVRADRVLTHVPDPARAIREMVRVLKPGGRVVVSEPDVPGCWVAHRRQETSDRILRTIAMSCRQPFVARDLYHLFLDAGVVDVRLMLRPLAITEPEPVETILRFGATVEAMTRDGLLDAEEARQWCSELEERRSRDRFLAGVTIFIVAGRKPCESQA
ncbi:MAG TPA: methyltransferase domain-containing protein [Dongiaceae bacterium]|nr:methyltransferase domain-containing protein [Dongiaceae bacterium]